MQQAVPLRAHSDSLTGPPVPPEIPRLLLMRWDGIEFWERHLCERDRRSLDHVRQAINDLKNAPSKAAFDRVSKVSRSVANDLRAGTGDRSQPQLWRGKHIAHLLDGIEDESTAASAAFG